jgi:ParB family chromosome partitioning protein
MKRGDLRGSKDLFSGIKQKGKSDIKIQMISLDKISIVDNVREKYDDIDELKESIRIHGVQSPIKVVDKIGKYEIIYGHRRYLASKELSKEDEKFSKIPCIVENKEKNEEEIIEIQLIENVDRADLFDYEKGRGLSKYKELTKKSNGEIAKRFGKGEKWVRDILSTYEIIRELESSLTTDELEKFKNIPTGIVVETKGLDLDKQKDLLKRFLENKLNQKEIRQLKKELKKKSGSKEKIKNESKSYVSVMIDKKKYKLEKDNLSKIDKLIKYIEENEYDENFVILMKDLLGHINN